MKLCRSHITPLKKIITALAFNQTMNYTHMLLSLGNSEKVAKAKKLIQEAIKILQTVE